MRITTALGAFITITVILGCANVPSEDDPRSTSEFAEDGSCSGSSRSCDARPANACNSGCSLQQGCASPYVGQCATLSSAGACDTNPNCRWSLSNCEPADICYIWDTPGECASDSDGCVWGQTCQGYPDSCYEFETSATCRAQGCSWEADF